jgi:hypothetical protein
VSAQAGKETAVSDDTIEYISLKIDPAEVYQMNGMSAYRGMYL